MNDQYIAVPIERYFDFLRKHQDKVKEDMITAIGVGEVSSLFHIYKVSDEDCNKILNEGL